jgi:aryl-alcohol dehydrogenase-like predicted oxidoreductase
MWLSKWGRPSTEQGIATIHAALDAGVTLIDTADAYCLDDADMGHCERLIARALRGYGGRKGRVLVATKGGVDAPRRPLGL